MLQQTVIKAVIPAYERFIARFPNIEALAQAAEEDVRQASRGLGYYRRFRMLHEAAQMLVHRKSADGLSSADIAFWPQNFKEWLELPGVGTYTGAAIASIAFQEAVPVVDGNVERVYCRLMDIREEPNQSYLKKAFFDLGLTLISQKDPGNFNQALMELGQRVCTKLSPQCSICPLQQFCLAFARNSQSEAPKTKTRPQATELRGVILIACYGKKIGLIQRPEAARFLAGHTGFLTGFMDTEDKISWDGQPIRRTKLANRLNEQFHGKIKHTITRFRMEMDVRSFQPKNVEDYEWLSPHEVEPKLIANLDRKAWRVFEKSRIDESPLFGRKRPARSLVASESHV